ncbi:MAG: helix-turn-helix domain-containing protein [Firmicutes bacterium]|nr:helix-turn-helix domain-containing protein [Bacillota bacterium]
MTTKQIIAERLRYAFDNAHITQAELGEKVGLSQSTIACYLSGYRSPNLVHFALICKELGVSAEEVFECGIDLKICSLSLSVAEFQTLRLKNMEHLCCNYALCSECKKNKATKEEAEFWKNLVSSLATIQTTAPQALNAEDDHHETC